VNVIKIQLRFLLLIGLLVSCSRGNHQAGGRDSSARKQPVEVATKSAQAELQFQTVLEAGENLPERTMEEIVDSIRFIHLETTDDCYVGDIDKVAMFRDRIVLFDKQKAHAVFLFDGKGRFLKKYNSMGKGPGEFTYLDDIAVARDSIYVLINSGTIIRFDRDMKTWQSIKLDCWAGELAVDTVGNGFVVTGMTNEGDVNWCNSSGKSTGRYLAGHNAGNMFSMHPFSFTNGKILFYHPMLDSVYEVTQQGCRPVRFVNYDKEKSYITYFENDQHIMFHRFLWFLVKSKATGIGYTVSTRTIADPYYSLLYQNWWTNSTVGNWYISIRQPNTILSIEKPADKRIRELQRSTDWNANPILVFTRLKDR
jgi:hypothetical protein